MFPALCVFNHQGLSDPLLGGVTHRTVRNEQNKRQRRKEGDVQDAVSQRKQKGLLCCHFLICKKINCINNLD